MLFSVVHSVIFPEDGALAVALLLGGALLGELALHHVAEPLGVVFAHSLSSSSFIRLFFLRPRRFFGAASSEAAAAALAPFLYVFFASFIACP